TPSATATHTTTTQPLHQVSYSAQVVMPFGDNINHPAGVAVDTPGNVYVLDYYYGHVWKLVAGTNTLTQPFSDLGQSVEVAVDPAATLSAVDSWNKRVLKLAAGVPTPPALPFTDLSDPWGVAVDTAGNVYVTDRGNNRVLKLAPGAANSI